jgi:uncharacterized protein YndB with AHSA1/START domain
MTLTRTSDREFVLTRVFAAPRRLVFAAWTRPEHVRRWYGCSAMTLAECEIDLRVGGAWRYVLRAPDGIDHIMTGIYREIAPPGRLVYTERYVTQGFTSSEALVTVLFAQHDGMTTLTSTVLHASREACDGHLGAGMERGAAEVYDRLEALLRTLARDGMSLSGDV